jgi:hypothetical protein
MIERDPATGFPVFRPDGAMLRAFMRDEDLAGEDHPGAAGQRHVVGVLHAHFPAGVEQPLVERDGKKRQRFRAHVLRETYSKLEETTIPTWQDWFHPGTGPGQFGVFYETRPYRHEIRVGPLELDVVFVAMEDIKDAKSFFMSLETSLIWFNEVQFAQYDVFSEAVGRVSPPRFPAVKDGGCAWGGLIADTNAPPADHWLPIMRGDVPPPDWMTEEKRNALKKPANWGFYMQPPGLLEDFDEKGHFLGYKPNPDAENLKYLPPGFYDEKIAGKTKSWIDANIMNRSSVVTDGQPVYPQFRRDVHVSERPLEKRAGRADHGRARLRPAAGGADHAEPARRLVRAPRIHRARHAGGRVRAAAQGVPRAAVARGEVQFLGRSCRPAPRPGHRQDAVPDFRRERHDGAPGAESAEPAHGAVGGGERGADAALERRRAAVGAAGRPALHHVHHRHVGRLFHAPDPGDGRALCGRAGKNQYSHICEAGENGFLGGGEGKAVTMGSGPATPAPMWNKRKTMRRVG